MEPGDGDSYHGSRMITGRIMNHAVEVLVASLFIILPSIILLSTILP